MFQAPLLWHVNTFYVFVSQRVGDHLDDGFPFSIFLTRGGSGGASTGLAWTLPFSFSNASQGFLLRAPESVDLEQVG